MVEILLLMKLVQDLRVAAVADLAAVAEDATKII
jgi:hypothetical protein